jgi:hypothetical protein
MAAPGGDHYATLGVAPGANARTIRAAYKALAQRCHPDKTGGADPEAMARMAEINAAYRVLGDPRRRSQYDQERARERRAAEPRTADARHPRRRRRRGPRGPSLFARAMEQLVGLLLMLLMIGFVVVFVALMFLPWPQPQPHPQPHWPGTATVPAPAAAGPSRPPAQPQPLHYE